MLRLSTNDFFLKVSEILNAKRQMNITRRARKLYSRQKFPFIVTLLRSKSPFCLSEVETLSLFSTLFAFHYRHHFSLLLVELHQAISEID